jgi:hypothetical protein
VVPLTRRQIRDNAKKRERMAKFVDRIGIEEVKEALA